MNSFPRSRPPRGTRVCCNLFTTVHECTHTIPPSSPSYSNEAWIPGFLCRFPLFPRSCIIHHSFLFHAPFTSDGLQGLPFSVLSWPGKPLGRDEERDFHSPRGGGVDGHSPFLVGIRIWGHVASPDFSEGSGWGRILPRKDRRGPPHGSGGVSIHVPTGLFRVPSLSAVPSPRNGFPSVPRSKGEKPWGSSPLGSRHRTRIQRCVRRTSAHERAMATKGAHRAFHVWRRGRKQTESRRSDVEMARMDVAEGGA
eukprot:scaffold2125_cov363-Pavlova_lutheri.AAC.2